MIGSRIFGTATVVGYLVLANVATAQPAETPQQIEADRAVAHDRASMRAAEASKNPAAMKAESAELNRAYVKDWYADHPDRRPSNVIKADQLLALRRSEVSSAKKSGDTKRLKLAEQALNVAYQQDLQAHRQPHP